MNAKGKAGSSRKVNPIKKIETKGLLSKYGEEYYKASLNKNEKVEQKVLNEIIANNPNFDVEDVVNRFQYLHKMFLMEQKKETAAKKKSKWDYFVEMRQIFDAIKQQTDLSGSSLEESNAQDLPAVKKEFVQLKVKAETDKEKVVAKELVQPEAIAESEKEKVVEKKHVQPKVEAENEKEEVSQSFEDETGEKPEGPTEMKPR